MICRSNRAGAAAKLAPSMVTPRRLAAGASSPPVGMIRQDQGNGEPADWPVAARVASSVSMARMRAMIGMRGAEGVVGVDAVFEDPAAVSGASVAVDLAERDGGQLLLREPARLPGQPQPGPVAGPASLPHATPPVSVTVAAEYLVA